MQQSQRTRYNHALNYAINEANQLNLPVMVYFALLSDYPDANYRHYQFMLEGLREVKNELEILGIEFVVKLGNPLEVLTPLLNDAAMLVMDYGYLKHQRQWRLDVINYVWNHQLTIDVIEVESDLVIPVKCVYQKLAYGAYTIRPSIMRHLNDYLDFKESFNVNHQSSFKMTSDVDLDNIGHVIQRLHLDMSVKPYHKYHGGYLAAVKHLDYFLNHLFSRYDQRSDPALGIQSYLSMYLHFGQISVQEIIKRVNDYRLTHQIESDLYDGFIEQLVVRRELAYNFVTYNEGYDQFESITEPWAYQTMKERENDPRPTLYTKAEIEHGKTHDPYFNAAMDEMRITGFMANYMRMYWAKKIMEWSVDMKQAYDTIVELNNKYFIDGRDANSYGNIAWCFGRHDRPWGERQIFGKLRYMNDSGLKKKFDIETYVEHIQLIKAEELLTEVS
jgi:deoxyribodipyrimidine photo-lyase